MTEHPALLEERAHLVWTLEIIRDEQARADIEVAQAAQALGEARRSQPDALPVREMLSMRAEESARHLRLAAQRPYFTRVDFLEPDGLRTYYIGRWGVMRSDTLTSVVTDWRAPVANLYYSGQIGPMHYEAPDGVVEGELTLKRQFGIEKGRLRSIFDVDLATADALLQRALGARTSERLRDIVTTIQSEQNLVIRHPMDSSMIVQGAPGSGKTTVALHRIAFLLYRHPELQPEQMVILAPSPLFLGFISGVLPDLGVERVRQTTFEAFVREAIALPPAAAGEAADEGGDAGITGAAGEAARLDDWLDQYEKSFAASDIHFGPALICDSAELAHFLLVDEAPFPMARRLKEFEKLLAARVRGTAKRMERFLADEAARRARSLREAGGDPAALRKRLANLYESLDARTAEVKAEVKPFIRRVMRAFPATGPLEVYRLYLQDQSQQAQSGLGAASARTLARLNAKGRIRRGDIAPMALIALRLTEIKRPGVRHLVIDEAQDLSPLEFVLLGRLSSGATVTAVGDLMQSIGAGGLTDWAQIGPLKGAARRELTISYRSTVEIMRLAQKVAARFPAPGVSAPRPVLRNGDEPAFIAYCGACAQAEGIAALAARWLASGMGTVAVIGRWAEGVEALFKRLPESLGAKLLRAGEQTEFTGLLLADAKSVKGLEFDAVILADAGEASFPDDPGAARLLYVCLTRALHKLAVFYEDALSPLLR